MNSLKELWTHIKGEVKETSGMADASYNLWIKDLELSRLTESCAYILAPYDYQLNILSNKYKPIIEECICNCIGFEVEAVIISVQKPERPIDDIIDDHIAYGGEPVGSLSSVKVLNDAQNPEKRTSVSRDRISFSPEQNNERTFSPAPEQRQENTQRVPINCHPVQSTADPYRQAPAYNPSDNNGISDNNYGYERRGTAYDISSVPKEDIPGSYMYTTKTPVENEPGMDTSFNARDKAQNNDPHAGNEEAPYEGNIQGRNVIYHEEYTFENFIVGNSNKYAHAACIAVTNNPASMYNPLFIHGPSGLGKTHLLYAITNKILRSGKAKNVLYVRGEDFTNQMINTLVHKQPMMYFRERFRNVDVLLMDDIQFIAGKEAIQEEFFHTFNDLHENRKQIILTSDRPPKDIATLEDRLKSRFEWGLIVDIQPPDLETRVAILRRKSESMGINVPDEVLLYLAEQIKSNIRQLEGAVKKLNAYSFLNNTPITVEFAKRCIQDIISGTEPLSVTVDKIFNVVSNKYAVSVEDIKSKKRNKEISQARHSTIYLLRKTTDLSLNDIGRMFDQHHTTVLSAINKMEEEVENNPAIEQEIADLMKDIK
ncbi:MAG: chromosomal replication initiator protein DnaA [Ruminococcaceae bacterium]|nr:chromosomal replication initiator protein DnaA [Oscillospiraceae bacterium]